MTQVQSKNDPIMMRNDSIFGIPRYCSLNMDPTIRRIPLLPEIPVLSTPKIISLFNRKRLTMVKLVSSSNLENSN